MTMTSIVSEESLARDTHTDTRTYRQTDILTLASSILNFIKVVSDFENKRYSEWIARWMHTISPAMLRPSSVKNASFYCCFCLVQGFLLQDYVLDHNSICQIDRYLVFNAQSTAKVVSGRLKRYQYITSRNEQVTHYVCTTSDHKSHIKTHFFIHTIKHFKIKNNVYFVFKKTCNLQKKLIMISEETSLNNTFSAFTLKYFSLISIRSEQESKIIQ